SMLSSYGIRTLSTRAQGFWPLSYHGGSVWSHDTAITLFGMYRAGLHSHARQVRERLVAAARHFNYRVPELHAGDEVDKALRGAAGALPYPAACRPQAWSAAAAVVCWKSVVEENRAQGLED
ncbi:MAG TPA: amylo-alpha-1,6-glucosidase, partial [Beutenbergiaceae bacterium]|nr:amylo-alpha-1,6-glucosidase [Beutenbergiaceae bacterium]